MAAWACSRRSAADQSSPATPTIGQLSKPRRSSRYSEWKVITLARSPVMPKITSASAACAPWAGCVTAELPVRGSTAVVIGAFSRRGGLQGDSRYDHPRPSSPDPRDLGPELRPDRVGADHPFRRRHRTGPADLVWRVKLSWPLRSVCAGSAGTATMTLAYAGERRLRRSEKPLDY